MGLPYRDKSEGDKRDEIPEMSPDEFFQNVMQSRAEAEAIISTAEDDLRRLNEMKWSLRYTPFILAAAITINLGLLFILTWQYYLYWIMASFIFLMVNPFLIMLPTDVDDLKSYIGYVRDLKNRERRDQKEVKSGEASRMSEIADKTETLIGLSRQRRYLYELAWNLFFMNCQPLAPGFLVLFALSSVFAFAGWAINGEFESFSSIIVIVQSVAIIVFYAAIVHVQPYSRGFFTGMLGAHSRFKEKYEEAWSQGLKYALTAVVLITITGIIFIAAILLPGFTYGSFRSAEADIHIRAGTFAFVFLTQMIVVRHLQGKYSRKLVQSLLASKIEAVQKEVLPAISNLESASLNDGVILRMTNGLKKVDLDIIRHRMLKIDYRSIFGYFPVCLINPDIGAIMSISEKADRDLKKVKTGETAG
ncbi:hypothetical protein SZ63_03130 [Methanoculleus sediminis]|uniref:Uncharacterized protein n=1 Tax=Methanoculleus sediminis TaxID=1550566 RepID=A0A0H1R5V9_9EURY|nr:hypothetical protein [Methanoculleus sediminis]KLK88077.1 hypothetical protein SZ63_03130 [Methanoculleus sediminis]